MQNAGELRSGPTRGQWMALVAAILGWMFDGLEMGLFPLIARPAHYLAGSGNKEPAAAGIGDRRARL